MESKSRGLTPKQQAILHYIQQYIHEHHYAPTYREIMHRFQLASLGSVSQYLKALEKKGALLIDKQMARGLKPISVFKGAEEAVQYQVPWIGNFSAGYPLELFIDPQMMMVPSYLVYHPQETYIIRVVGSSLSSEGMQDGDFLLIESRQEIFPGEVILGLINGNDSLLKRYYPEGQSIRLESVQSALPPLTVRSQHISIQGVLVGMMRVYG